MAIKIYIFLLSGLLFASSAAFLQGESVKKIMMLAGNGQAPFKIKGLDQ